MGKIPCCDKTGLNKGKWTAEEDEKLISYIKENGDGSWRSLPKNEGLLRCGKSCRLRWMNYLRDDVKRGNFSVIEEETIVKLHKTLGNKWSLIASHLPGRTDNEIKNFWNSHLSRRIYRYRSIGALSEADLIQIKMKQAAPKKSSAKNAYLHNEARKTPTTDAKNNGIAESNGPTGGIDMEYNCVMAEDKDTYLPDAFVNNETRGVNTTGPSYSSELFVSPNEVIGAEDLGLWDGLDENILMHVEEFLEVWLSEKSDGDRMIFDEYLKEKGSVSEKGCGEWGLNIENMDFPACSSPIYNTPYYYDEGLRWDHVNGGGEEFNLWNWRRDDLEADMHAESKSFKKYCNS